jgi:hypothetical protein
MIRYLREAPRPGAPNAEIRAHIALKRERAKYYRTRERKPEQLTDEPELKPAAAGIGPAHIEAALAIEQIAGADARRLAELRGEGHTLSDAARVLHWDARRVEAARKQIERHKDRIARALNTRLKEDSDGV